MHLDLAHAEAARYRSRGIPLDDLRQVAALALTKAARGYDVTTGHDFLSYAVPTIRGELRKHFRDHGWMIRPPRRIQELQARINAAEAELSYRLGRSPQPVEIADHLDECTRVGDRGPGQRRLLRARLPRPPRGRRRVDHAGRPAARSTTTEHRAAEARLMLRPVLRDLGERDRQILEHALLRGPDPARDRGPDRGHPDAGLPAADPHPGPAAQRRRRGAARRRTELTDRRPSEPRHREPARRPSRTATATSGKSVSTPSTPRSSSRATSAWRVAVVRARAGAAQVDRQVPVLAAQRPHEHVEPGPERLAHRRTGRPTRPAASRGSAWCLCRPTAVA